MKYYYYTIVTQANGNYTMANYTHGVCDYHPLVLIIETKKKMSGAGTVVLVYSEEITKEQHDEFIKFNNILS